MIDISIIETLNHYNEGQIGLGQYLENLWSIKCIRTPPSKVVVVSVKKSYKMSNQSTIDKNYIFIIAQVKYTINHWLNDQLESREKRLKDGIKFNNLFFDGTGIKDSGETYGRLDGKTNRNFSQLKITIPSDSYKYLRQLW